jgi:Family of unknown function (DUF6090)
MIKFFSSIRKKLVSEKPSTSRTTNYLKYAIGEIVLVVIGILIALSINNWNDIRKENNQELYILKQLQKEFKADSLLVYQFGQLTKGKTSQANSLKNIVINKAYNTRIDSVVFNAFFIGKLVIFNSYTPTFDELVSSGKLHIIKSEKLKKLIKRFKNSQKIQKSFMYDESQKRIENYNTHLFKYFEPQTMTYFWESGPGNIKIDSLKKYHSDVKGFINDSQTLYHINIALAVNRQLSWGYRQRTIQSIQKILHEIQLEIDKHNQWQN